MPRLETTARQQLPELLGAKTRLSNKHICTEDKIKTKYPPFHDQKHWKQMYSMETVNH